uniref:Uncharacterized protein n=1 Tax=Anguilla anguilla TaxID=7936 RepID=A0A0E9R7G1_ANGAN
MFGPKHLAPNSKKHQGVWKDGKYHTEFSGNIVKNTYRLADFGQEFALMQMGKPMKNFISAV